MREREILKTIQKKQKKTKKTNMRASFVSYTSPCGHAQQDDWKEAQEKDPT